MKPLRLAWLNLVRRRGATAIALTAIALSVACSGILLRLYLLSSSRFDTLAKAGDAIVGAKAGGIEILLNALNLEGSYPDFLPYVLYESLKSKKSVRFEDQTETKTEFTDQVIPFLFFAKYRGFRVIATNEDFVKRFKAEDSPLLLKGRWASGPAELVVGSRVAEREGLKLGARAGLVTWTGDKNLEFKAAQIEVPFTVVGIFEPTATAFDSALFSNMAAGQEMLSHEDLTGKSIWKSQVLHYFLIYTHPGGFGALRDLINKRTVAQVISVAEEKQKLEDLTGTGRYLGLFTCLLIMILGGLSVAGMMLTRFESMMVQLAVLRAIGYQRREITRWLIYEGLILGLAASLIGALVDFALFPAVRSILGSALPSPQILSSSIILSAPVWFAAILATIAATVIPLLRLYRQDVHLSLKA